ncbi:MAG: CC0125/CC1285 family lipoprotein [Phenylobacterium sp.]|uniref:CC0125/CC1285 family lipoprotein n=1 Tax=Phenylobacterium sp. TaxID=1871053 RepID=UPI00391C2C61
MKPKSVALAASLALAGLLSACATATPYQPNIPGQAVSGGYSDQQIETNRFRVTFSGNSLTSRETVEAYLLYRAAELTVQQGYDWFSVVEREVERDRRTYVERDPFYRPWYGPSYAYWRPSWRYYGPAYGWRTWDPYWGDPFWADRVDVRTVDRYEASAEILMRRGTKPADDPRAFDARAVIDNIGPRVVRPGA